MLFTIFYCWFKKNDRILPFWLLGEFAENKQKKESQVGPEDSLKQLDELDETANDASGDKTIRINAHSQYKALRENCSTDRKVLVILFTKGNESNSLLQDYDDAFKQPENKDGCCMAFVRVKDDEPESDQHTIAGEENISRYPAVVFYNQSGVREA